jgi:thiol-disulfide isomerase/thioredoxin
MKLRILSALAFAFLMIQCEKKQEIEIGAITEKSPEEIASYVEYAPKFTFNSIQGQEVSLESLKGKILYIDIWATWCKPCLQQLPAMKELEEKYRDSNVQFVSISVDQDKDKEKWARMIQEKEMKGLQLFAGKSTSFSQDYKVSSIPRFVIIGKNGELINDNAPRPMSHMTGGINEELVAMLDQLNM